MLFEPLCDACARVDFALKTSWLNVYQGRNDLGFGHTTTLIVAVYLVVIKLPPLATPNASAILGKRVTHCALVYCNLWR